VCRREAHRFQEAPRLLGQPGVGLAAVGDAVHLVDEHGHLGDAQQGEKVGVAARLLAEALGGVHDQYGGLRLGGAGDHVAGEFAVAGRVNDDDLAAGRAEERLGGVDRHGVGALLGEVVHGVGELHVAPLHAARAPQGLHRLGGQAARVVEQATDEGGLAVVHVADDDEAQGGLVAHGASPLRTASTLRPQGARVRARRPTRPRRVARAGRLEP